MKYIILSALFLPALIGCKDDPEPAIDLLVNNSMEIGDSSPNSWLDLEQTVYSTEWTSEEANSGNKSLKITATQTDPTNIAFWAQSFSGSIPVGKDVVLSIRIKGKNLTGQGISIAIRGDAETPRSGLAEQFGTTEGEIDITGSFDWTTYNVRLNGIDSNIKELTVFLIFLPNSTGTVYFDDASLRVQ